MNETLNKIFMIVMEHYTVDFNTHDERAIIAKHKTKDHEMLFFNDDYGMDGLLFEEIMMHFYKNGKF